MSGSGKDQPEIPGWVQEARDKFGLPPEGVVARPLVHFAQSGGQLIEALEGRAFDGLEPRYIRFSDGAMLDANMNVVEGGAKITVHGYDPAEAIRGYEIDMVWHDEMEGNDMLDETAPPPLVTPTDPAGPPPRALSNNVNHRDFHPSYMRVGVRIDGVERKDLKWYDVRAGLAATTDGVMLKSDTIEPFWRYPENRQQRRARERWEAKHKGRGQ